MAALPAPSLHPPALTNGVNSLRIATVPGYTNILQYSVGLTNWVSLSTNLVSGDFLDLNDAVPGGNTRRFYRSLLVP